MFLRKFWPRVRRFVPVSLYPLLAIPYRWERAATLARLERADAAFRAANPGVTAPEARLRYNVVGPCSIQEFLVAGLKSIDFLESGLTLAGATFSRSGKVLDWGCGCGRSVLGLQVKFPNVRIHGADVDMQAIDWCAQHIKGTAEFKATPALPPLPYTDGQFDVVYTISVFTHLDEERQNAWLAEMRRIIRPGGVLLATVHGPKAWEGLPAATVEQIRRQGIIFARTAADAGIHPDWYQTTWHTQTYIRAAWSAYFDVRAYVPEGMVFEIAEGIKIVQDLVVLVRRPE